MRPQRRWDGFPDCGLSSGRDAASSLEVGGGVGASGHCWVRSAWQQGEWAGCWGVSLEHRGGAWGAAEPGSQ